MSKNGTKNQPSSFLDTTDKLDFLKKFSHEALSEIQLENAVGKLECYEELLIKWNKQFNLVAPSTIHDIWQRHFVDSLQLLPFLPEEKTHILDLGSGAGFPALPMAICSHHQFTLVDMNLKKTTFLNKVKTELALENVDVFQGRIETLDSQNYGILSSRALASLTQLLEYAEILLDKSGFCLFLKGEQFEKELTEAQNYWKIKFELKESLTHDKSVIVKITDFSKK